MWHRRNAIFILNGGSDGHGAGALTDIHLLETAIRQGLVDKLAVVGGDIDVFRIKLFQLINDIIHLLDAIALQGGQDLKRERCALALVYQVYYFHFITFFGANVAFYFQPSPICAKKEKERISPHELSSLLPNLI